LIPLVQRDEDRADDDGYPSRTTYQGSVDQGTMKTFPAWRLDDASFRPQQKSALELAMTANTSDPFRGGLFR
jgi:hypothetical protein